jgi:septum formation protein
MAHLGRPFTVVVPDVDETPLPGESPDAMVLRLALAKARAVEAAPGAVVVAADTTVALGDEILAKPVDSTDAVAMLRRLSGRTHLVHTGVAVRHGELLFGEIVSARLTMREIDEPLAKWYVATGEPLDKAGAYAVQGIGGMLVERVDGDVQAVIGLPMATVCRLAGRVGVVLPAW